uniref:Uncharacterized protein n=1 Tax=Panagrolaimus davidi TaxID=227884 RepID=A0A914Q4Y7_9BILA
MSCTTCGTLGFAPPPPEYSIVASGGFISPSNNAAGCKQYFVGCYEYADKAIIIGANQQFLPLSLGTPGAKSVILTCNNAGQIQGQMWGNGDTIVPITSVYCSRQI